MTQPDLREVKEIAAKHGWTAQEGGGYPDGSDRTGVMFTRNDEVMTTEWFTGADVAEAFVWADYVSNTEPESVYTQHFAVMVEFITTAPTNSGHPSE